MKLSFSQLSKFSQCARSYKHHYQDRLREKSTTSYLSFGSAIDQSLNAVLQDLKDNGKVTVDYISIFDEVFQTCEVNKRKYNTIDCTLIGYSKNDFIEDLLTKEDLNYIKAKKIELAPEIPENAIPTLHAGLEQERSIRNVVPMKENHHRLLNTMNFLSMRRKAHCMLKSYVRDIVPQIEEVRDIQLPIVLDGGNDSLIGYVDAVVKFKGNSYYSIMDNKTSASVYDIEKVAHSQQLALYCYATGLQHGSFAVMLKNIKMNRIKYCSQCGFDGSGGRHKTCANEIEGKRCGGEWDESVSPEGITQLLQDEIPLRTQELFVDNIADINESIKHGIFAQNFSNCLNMFGSRCGYYELCFKGNSDKLEKV